MTPNPANEALARECALEQFPEIPNGSLHYRMNRERCIRAILSYAEKAQLEELTSDVQAVMPVISAFMDACAVPKQDMAAEKKAINYAYELGRNLKLRSDAAKSALPAPPGKDGE